MTDTELLEDAIRDAGIKISKLMEATNIRSYTTFKGRMKNCSEFTASEIQALCDALKLTPAQRTRIFFRRND